MDADFTQIPRTKALPSSTSHCEMGSNKRISQHQIQEIQAGYFLRANGGPLTRLTFERDIHFDAIGDRDERNTFIHPVVLAVEGHGPVDRA